MRHKAAFWRDIGGEKLDAEGALNRRDREIKVPFPARSRCPPPFESDYSEKLCDIEVFGLLG